MELEFLQRAFKPNDDNEFVERLFPPQVVIREEMETAFKEMFNNGVDSLTMFSGIPVIGKSILMFLVVL